MAEATACTDELLTTARGLLAAVRPHAEARGLTMLGVSLSNLPDDAAVQLALPFDPRRTGTLDAAIDGVRDRYGSAAITRAVLLNRASGTVMPLLPD